MSTNPPQEITNPSERYGFEYDIDNWYEKCKSFTTYSKFIPITQSEAKVMIKQYEIHLKNQKEQQVLSNNEYEILKNLQEKITQELATNPEFYDEALDTSSAFVRLGSRSPKDAAFNSQKIHHILQRKLYEKNAMILTSHDTKIQSNQDKQNNEFISFFESQVEVMRIESGEEAIEMMTSSSRIYDDLNIALKYRNSESLWNVYFVLRKWIPHHDIQLEFRTFVYNRKLCAISQYNDALFFEYLNNNKQLLLKAMLNFFEKVKDEIPFDHCVMDLVIYPSNGCLQSNLEELNVQVLEFNPYNQYTGSALFSWIKDIQVLKGEKPFEFRIREDSLPVLRNYDFSQSGCPGKSNQLMFNLIEIQDQNIIEEHSDLIEMVDDFLNNDLERIHSNFKYVVQKTTTESATERLNNMGI